MFTVTQYLCFFTKRIIHLKYKNQTPTYWYIRVMLVSVINKFQHFNDLGSKVIKKIKKSLQIVTAAMKFKDTPGKERCDKPRHGIKNQRYHFPNKGSSSQSYAFSSSHVQMWELDHKEEWVPKNWYFWIVVLEKTLESPRDCKEIKPWIFIGRTDAETEAPVLWPPDAKSWLIGKGPDVGKNWIKRRRGRQRMRWLDNHQLNGHDFEQTLREKDRALPWHSAVHGVTKESDITEQLNINGNFNDWTQQNLFFTYLTVQ